MFIAIQNTFSDHLLSSDHIHFYSFYSLYWSSVYAWQIVLIKTNDSLIYFKVRGTIYTSQVSGFQWRIVVFDTIVIHTCA